MLSRRVWVVNVSAGGSQSGSLRALPQVNPKVGHADTHALGDLSDLYDPSQTPLGLYPHPLREG